MTERREQMKLSRYERIHGKRGANKATRKARMKRRTR